MSARETAWRVLATELAASTVETKSSGNRTAGYLLSPLGARMNRVLVTGVLGRAESIGKDPSQPFYRARLEDPTGPITVTAGGFQPRALTALRESDGPRRTLLVGKTHLFLGRDGTTYPSVRAESMRPLTDHEYQLHLVDAVRQTLDRVDLIEALRPVDVGKPAPELSRWAPTWVRGAQEARERYPSVDLSRFRDSLRSVLASLESPSPSLPAAPDPAQGKVTVTRTPTPSGPARVPSAEEREEEAAFLAIIDELGEQSVDGYADLRDSYRRLAGQGIPEAKAERILNRLEEAGALEEPIVGKLRRT